MKIEHVYPDYITRQIEAIDRQLVDIEKEYLEECLRYPFKVRTLKKNYRNDWRVKTLKKQKAYIYKTAVYKTIITAETEEEKKMLKERFREYENNIS